MPGFLAEGAAIGSLTCSTDKSGRERMDLLYIEEDVEGANRRHRTATMAMGDDDEDDLTSRCRRRR
jgi:hypothetical protein